MRELKFRAWCDANKTMYEFDLMWGNTWQQGAGYIGMVPVDEGFKRTGFCRDNKQLISPNEVEIMQYTGLKDINGKEIFESDILYGLDPNNETTPRFEVKFDRGMWYFEDQFDGYDFTSLHCAIDLGYEFEIIGNIYENPDLIKKEG